MIKIGLIGCGYWGPNLLRNFVQIPDCTVSCIAEINEERIAYLRQKHPSIAITRDYYDLFTRDIDAIVIATQPSTHYQFAKEALEHGKHVLVEKPLTLDAQSSQALVKLALSRNLKLMVGHTFEYNAAVKFLKEKIKRGVIGQTYYINSQRLNFGIIRKDINALWSLASHDVSILNFLTDSMPLKVAARGYDFVQKGVEDVVFLSCHYPNDIEANVQVSWLDPHKTRRMTVVGSERTIIYDELADAKIQIYDKGLKCQNMTDSLGLYDDFGQFQLMKSAGDVVYPKINFTEPLKEECEHFVNCIIHDQTPLTDGINGLKVVAVLEAAQRSLKEGGREIAIDQALIDPLIDLSEITQSFNVSK